MGDTVFTARARGTYRVGDRLRASWYWAVARRATLTLRDDRLTFGDWSLPYAEFERAAVLAVPTVVGLGLTLMVWHGGRVYQFQLYSASAWRYVADPFWGGPLPFPVERQTRPLEAPSRWLLTPLYVLAVLATAVGLLLPLLGR